MPAGACASEPAPPGRAQAVARARARSFGTWVSVLALKTSTMSTAPAAHRPGSTRPRLERSASNGCGAYTRPPCALIRATTSATGSTYGTRSVRKRPRTSPAVCPHPPPAENPYPRLPPARRYGGRGLVVVGDAHHVQAGLRGPVSQLLQ